MGFLGEDKLDKDGGESVVSIKKMVCKGLKRDVRSCTDDDSDELLESDS